MQREYQGNGVFTDAEKKFDFQNIDVKLYLALKAVMNPLSDAKQGQLAEEQAMLALEEFELSHGPLPDWVVGRNWDYSLVPGAQLCTKDGRRTGNAHIIKTEVVQYGDQPEVLIYHCITDAGNQLAFSEPEILEAFTIGDWISDPKRVLKDLDRHGYF